MAFSQDNQDQKGYQEVNRTNKFDKQRTDPISEILGNDVMPESAKDHYLRTKKFKHLPQLQQEFIRNLQVID